MTGERFFVDHLLALRASFLREGALLAIRVRFAMKFHMLVEAGAIEFFFAKSTHTPQFEFWLLTSSAAFATTTWVVTMVARQRMQMRMPRLAHFYNHVYSVGDTRVPDSKKGDVFWW